MVRRLAVMVTHYTQWRLNIFRVVAYFFFITQKLAFRMYVQEWQCMSLIK